MQFGPAPMVEIVDIASFHPDVIPHGRKRCCIRIRIGGANIHGILLRDRTNAYRLDDQISLLVLVGRLQEILVLRIEMQQDVFISIGFVPYGINYPSDA
jgi:hypothetical protein